MQIAGFQKLTLLDYPGHLAALIFTQGCNFACGYCHNPEMIPSIRILPDRPELEPRWILDFLKSRKNLLDGVVITGGEPTLHDDLPEFMSEIKKLGFLIKLDSNGSHPEVLSKAIDKNLVDYIAMDIKARKEKYAGVVKNRDTESILKSIKIIMNAPVDYEFRSTIMPILHNEEDIIAMGGMIRGAKRWYLQNFRPRKTLLPSFRKERGFLVEEMNDLLSFARPFASEVGIRNG